LAKTLGDALARQGRFAEAITAFDRALALDPCQIGAHFAAIEAKKCTAADRPRLAHIRRLLAQMGLEEDREVLHFAAGKLLDDLGDYNAAMQHFEAANEIRRRKAVFDRGALATDVDQLIQRFTPEFFAANHAFGVADETPLLIVGMPRSGTTLVEQILSCHPQIGAGGELTFWVRTASAPAALQAKYLNADNGRATAQQYLSQLRRIASSALRITDKLPFNLLRVGLIHLLLPKARFIRCRRHPVDTCLSIYFTRFTQSLAYVSDKRDLAAAYREYERLMDHWCSVLPAECFFEVEYERLVADREAVTRELIAFTGLAWDERCLQPERNPRPVLTASLWQARQPVYLSSVARWRNYEPWLGALRQLFQASDRGSGAPAD
jgi:tetratricopeptide (TPR) repeat protein